MIKPEINIDTLIKAYAETPNLHKLAKMFHTSHIRISSMLKGNGISIQNIGKKRDVSSAEIDSMIADYCDNHLTTVQISKKYAIAVKRLRAVFRENGVIISKWSGHIKREKPVVKAKKERPIKVCPLCGWKTYNVGEKSLSFQHHLEREHGYDCENITGYLKQYPDDEVYVHRLLKNAGKVKCEICGKHLAILDDRHLMQKHGITKSEYLCRYGAGKLISESYLNVLHNNISKMWDNPNWERFSSSYEKEIQDFLNENSIPFTAHNRGILSGNREIDILVRNEIGIEFNGCLQHTEWFGGKDRQYHLSKTKECKEKGVRLIHIFEDEYMFHKDIVYSKLAHILGIHQDLPRVFARKCLITEIGKAQAENFLIANHIQGFVTSTVYLGAFYQGELIAVMLFKQERKDGDKWELTRFASSINCVCCGVGGKMFSHFVRKFHPREVKSFADRRWTINEESNLYTKLGFAFEGYTQPDYHYYYKSDNKPLRFHKFGFRKQTLSKKYGLPPTMTETEMVKELNYDRIWDCGLIKYIWKAN